MILEGRTRSDTKQQGPADSNAAASGAAGGGRKAALSLASTSKRGKAGARSAAAGSGAKAVASIKGDTGPSTSTGLTKYMEIMMTSWGEEPQASITAAQKSQSSSGPRAASVSQAPSQKGVKYSIKEVQALHAVFEEYDTDGNGYISLEELREGFLKEKLDLQRPNGRKKSLAERNTAARYMTSAHNGHRRVATSAAFLEQLTESFFAAIDKNRDGRATFRELLLLMYPLATPGELSIMLGWVAPKEGVAAERAPLSAKQEREVTAIFRMYDTDKSGHLSVEELKTALRSTGLAPEEVGELHAQFDLNSDGVIDFAEFKQLMLNSGLYDDVGSLAERTAIDRVAAQGARRVTQSTSTSFGSGAEGPPIQTGSRSRKGSKVASCAQ